LTWLGFHPDEEPVETILISLDDHLELVPCFRKSADSRLKNGWPNGNAAHLDQVVEASENASRGLVLGASARTRRRVDGDQICHLVTEDRLRL